ncbi:MAG TPA: hypothetical protein VIL36_10600 [Acidimicrobiales bacterium]
MATCTIGRLAELARTRRRLEQLRHRCREGDAVDCVTLRVG